MVGVFLSVIGLAFIAAAEQFMWLYYAIENFLCNRDRRNYNNTSQTNSSRSAIST